MMTAGYSAHGALTAFHWRTSDKGICAAAFETTAAKEKEG